MSSLLQLRTILQDLLLTVNPRVVRAVTIGLDWIGFASCEAILGSGVPFLGSHSHCIPGGRFLAAAKHMWTHEAFLPLGVPKPCPTMKTAPLVTLYSCNVTLGRV
jgi:hypothetical protein